MAILETHDTDLGDDKSPVRGLVRLVQVADGLTVLDVSLKGVREGKWGVSVRKSGDISRGAQSTGGIWEGEGQGEHDLKGQERRKGWIGEVEVGKEGKGGTVVVMPFSVWEIVGRGMVVERSSESEKDGEKVLGVIARSAGVWENDKTVCSCSGKTVWEEREEQKGRGML